MREKDYNALFNIYERYDVDEDVVLHMIRVAGYVMQFSKLLRLDENRRWHLEYAAMLHDIGKAMVPKHILNKPGKLTQEEFEEMKNHVMYGVHILRLEGVEGAVIDLISKHHEKSSGHGYPLGQRNLSEDDQVLAICDIYDAITTKRPYREALTRADAKECLIEDGYSKKLVILFFEFISRRYPEKKEKTRERAV